MRLPESYDPLFDEEPIEITRRINPHKKATKPGINYLGIDGEGIGRHPEVLGHRYMLLAVSNEDGSKKWYIEAPPDGRLRTEECLDFILNVAGDKKLNRKLFAYSFNYDLTKMLEDIEDDKLYYLFRPELRQRVGAFAKNGPHPVRWRGYDLNLQGTKFSISKGLGKEQRRVVIWDIWKFYQSKFVGALEDWKVGSAEDKLQIEKMKNHRSTFKDHERDAIREYCFSECRFMAILAHKLVKAHDDAGLKLTSFYGAGSSASAILKKMDMQAKLIPPPEEMKEAIASAFFGGRFENGMIGEVIGTVYNFDISSAYPYHLCFLPCLLHGAWSYTTNRKELETPQVKAACVNYRLAPSNTEYSWGPFPFRDGTGSICFPAQSGGGWVWKDEYLQGEKHFEGVEFIGAWVYRCECKCVPFADIPHYYRERCRIGKEGAGIVFKLGPNSCYGKLAQSVGSSPFRSWIYAGMITSGCRAQVLELIGLHKNRDNIVLIATDGVLTKEDIIPPTPLNTETNNVFWNPDKKCKEQKPLGGWERTVMTNGVFAARPGIYFPLNPTTDDLKKVRGRGVGKSTILENWRSIARKWKDRRFNLCTKTPDYSKEFTCGGKTKCKRHDPVITVKDLDRFCGAKTSISYAPKKNRFTRAIGGNDENGFDQPDYGQWVKRRVEMSFNPMPKREKILYDGIMLKLRVIPLSFTSMPYTKAMRSKEAVEMENATQEQLEQPDVDLVDPDDFAY